MNQTQQAAADAFHKLHKESSLFVMPCAWDAFSAILFEQAGFKCVGTTSGGVNWVNGRKDYVYNAPRNDMLHAYQKIANTTTLPVSGDLENGYGEHPHEVADTITASIQAGLVGGSIEDQKVVPTDEQCTNGELFEFDAAVKRITAARQSANEAPFHFLLTARCEVYYTPGKNHYEEAVKRLNAYREAGADCLFVPGLNDIKTLQQLVKDVDGPISFGMGATPEPITIPMLEDIGIKRVSTGGGLTRATFEFIRTAATDIIENGEFNYLNNAISEAGINNILETTNS